jgi:FkbM family methyltransferase
LSLPNAALDVLARMPYFRGKGALVLAILRAFPHHALTARLPNGGRLALGLDPLRQSFLPYWIGKYEAHVTRVFCDALTRVTPEEAVLDIGANIGFYSVIAAGARSSCVSGAVHAFEPNPRIFAELERNLALNHFTNAHAHCQAVGDNVSETTLYVQENAITYSSLRRTQDFLTQAIRVPVTTLDAYAREKKLKLGLIKLDVEGAELLALRGARQVLERDRPTVLYEEFPRGYQQFGYTTAHARAFLRDLDYQLFAIREPPRSRNVLQPLAVSDGDADAYQNVLALPATRT